MIEDNQIFELEKQCNRCGGCCRVLAFPVEIFTKEIKEYYKTRGIQEDDGWLVFPQRCKELSPTNLCHLHGLPEQPRVCRIFHGQKKMSGNVKIYIPKGCVYRAYIS